jgi:hypothetical protein
MDPRDPFPRFFSPPLAILAVGGCYHLAAGYLLSTGKPEMLNESFMIICINLRQEKQRPRPNGEVLCSASYALAMRLSLKLAT